MLCALRANITLSLTSIFSIDSILSVFMSLSGFEIAVGGITSVPLMSGLVLLVYKSFGEKRLEISSLAQKKVSIKSTPLVSNKNNA